MMSRCDDCTVPVEVRRNTRCCERCTPENPQSEGIQTTSRAKKYANGLLFCTAGRHYLKRMGDRRPEHDKLSVAVEKNGRLYCQTHNERVRTRGRRNFAENGGLQIR